ncbi:NAD(P)/FAD-dependent oxidoreductase [Paracoccus sp. 1_MG-2023]|uniref:NAD(P)/FAD-dependent oxidoreductase n=1 Tax=unclassified Paracoccus (in: a-proteobacteria) TaxID=2688777 RepID=UPI001C08EA70|nr:MULTISPECIES: NAD(P)/FAD-dependent oxidoreductase [unclassified Paracoccus (in: a-proteobacteria)]MBU2956525.1 NAD(P)/FAD-dependent oxidoreductase [Paracoccus sp. C2R09]MDO6670409.1 NAD(P)/FAD-dependent oxidoreductase [Paracoccus sp. 1_MG-2023]
MEHWDIVILGAGAAGLFCAGSALAQGRRVLVLDHAAKPAEKIRISGGGRCNFTNMATGRDRFLSANPRFAASALSRYKPADFVGLVDAAGIAWHEKTQGQLFCDGKATQITDMLLRRMRGAELRLETPVDAVVRGADGFRLTGQGLDVLTPRLVVATGGKSIPKIGATGFAYDLAQQFGLEMVETRPGLVPLTFAEQDLAQTKPLAGIATDARIVHGGGSFRDALLYTHRGISGPSILQISSFWRAGEELRVDLAPETDMGQWLRDQRGQAGRVAIATVLSRILPERLAHAIAEEAGLTKARLADQNNKRLDQLAARINAWTLRPVGTEGYRTAEVTLGGVDTRDLDAKTMEARKVPGLHFIGECVDVTGWLGGYNFQWAWASADAAGRA